MGNTARPTRIGVINNGILTEDGNPFNLKYAVLAAAPGDVLEDATTPNYVVGDALYRTGLVVDHDQRGLGVAWPAEQDTAGQGRAKVSAASESAAVIHATVGPGPNWFTISGTGYERETMDRVRAAILNGGYSWPEGRVTVTVETVVGRPLDSSHDLAIACAILGAAGHYAPDAMTDVAFIGELGLDGQVRPVADVNEAARYAIAAGCTTALIPDANMSDFDTAGIGVYSAENIDQAVRVLQTFDRANRANS
ncbi:magnesium chelatase domain-containing protein [Streptomyces sp. NPDC126510]|uniref:magnesium chelatase domain-containing protein n=1 Tax=Streptomyces sp. NPDC126510 TaxID=3155317 RepID=UPI00332BD0FB